MNPTWKCVDKTIKSDLINVLNSIMEMLKKMNSHIYSIKTCLFVISLIKNPWSHHYLPKILQGDASYDEGNILEYKNYYISKNNCINSIYLMYICFSC